MKRLKVLQFFTISLLTIEKVIVNSFGYSFNPESNEEKDEYNAKYDDNFEFGYALTSIIAFVALISMINLVYHLLKPIIQ